MIEIIIKGFLLGFGICLLASATATSNIRIWDAILGGACIRSLCKF